MKKKLVVAHVITSLKVGGAETFLTALLKKLKSLHVENHVIFFRSGPLEEEISALGIPTYHIQGLCCLYDPFFFKALYQIIISIKPDCIHSSLWAANVASRIIARLLHIPQISALHNNLDQDGFIRAMLDRLTQNYASMLVPVSHGVAQSLFVRDNWIKKSQVTVITNGIETQLFEHQIVRGKLTRQSLGLEPHHFVIGSVGRLVWLKNYPLLLNSFKEFEATVCQARLVIIGSGPEEKNLRALAVSIGIEKKVIFIMGQKALPYYVFFDCFILTSFKEGISMALLEAMYFGIPCITTKNGKHDVIKDKFNGLLVPSGDKNKIISAFKKLFHDKKCAISLGQNAKNTVINAFDINKTAQKYVQLYDRVIQLPQKSSL